MKIATLKDLDDFAFKLSNGIGELPDNIKIYVKLVGNTLPVLNENLNCTGLLYRNTFNKLVYKVHDIIFRIKLI